ncbi:HlyD family type I secretion periplasmic adaptor subunit [Pseudovibrio sp. JE062]|uniref:HlyD family type I secretion periplasmic adaptor subunit n=1 Tax=Pseudovibrio sp. JE062 TaxID=439495 RepID=UPI000186C23A|nr:HlyD family type I secretion periplasmic adaptor subunit [Pseudovibrio sp. JE062]EEA92534.1 type I secretion membrane fusion protein, HlyD [Pseudovibrio sp. JE062]
MKGWSLPIEPLHLPEFHSAKHSRILIFTCAGILLLLFVWSAFAHVEEVTRGDGRVIPSRQMQIVQAPERGIVSEVMFYEGEIVEQGAVLVKLDNTGFASQLGELQQKKYALQARLARLMAEARQANLQLDLSNTPSDIAAFLQRELEVYKARKDQLNAEVAVLRSQFSQKEQDLKQLEAEAQMLGSNLTIIARELEINQQLYKRGVLPEIEFLRLKRQYTTMHGEQQMLEASLASARSAKQEAMQRVVSAQTAFASKAQSDLVATKAELAVIEERLRGAEDRVHRSALVAPVRGVINKLNVSTIGAVVQAGEPLVEIVPLEDTLLIAAQIQPQHVAFLHPGQDVSVKVTAYDYSIYGGLEGVLERISPDTSEDERGQAFFKVIVRTRQNHLGSEENPLPITPGMTASIDILTGEKSVLSYIAKPLIKVKAEAFRER